MFKLKKVSLLALLVSANSFATYYATIDVSKKHYKIFGEEDILTEDFATLKEGWFAYLDSNCESQDQDGVKINSVYTEMTEWESNSIVCSSGSNMLPDSNDLVSVDGSLKFLNYIFNIPTKRTFYNLNSVKGDFAMAAYGSEIELKDIVVDQEVVLGLAFFKDINFSNFNSDALDLILINFGDINLNNVISKKSKFDFRNYNEQNTPYFDPEDPYSNNIDLKLYENSKITMENNTFEAAQYDFYSDFNLTTNITDLKITGQDDIIINENAKNLDLVNKNIETFTSINYNLDSSNDSNVNLDNINSFIDINLLSNSNNLSLTNKNLNTDNGSIYYEMNSLSDLNMNFEKLTAKYSIRMEGNSKTLDLKAEELLSSNSRVDLNFVSSDKSLINLKNFKSNSYNLYLNFDANDLNISTDDFNAQSIEMSLKAKNDSLINIENITSSDSVYGFTFEFDGNHQGTGSSIVNINNVSTLGAVTIGTSGDNTSIETYIDQLNLSNIVFRDMLSIKDYSFIDKLNITNVSSDVENATLQIENNAINEIVINTSTGDYLFNLVFNWGSMYIGSFTINNTHPTEFINIPVVKNQFSVNKFKDSTGIKVKITDLAALSYSSYSVRTPETTTFCTNYGTRNFVLDSEDNVVDKNLLCGDNSHLQTS